MNKNLFWLIPIWILTLIGMATFSTALITDDMRAFYTAEETAGTNLTDIYSGLYNWTPISSPISVTGKNGSARNTTTAGAYFKGANTATQFGAGNFTISIWVFRRTAVYGYIYESGITGTTSKVDMRLGDGGANHNYLTAYTFEGGANTGVVGTTNVMTDNQWHNYIFRRNGTTLSIYFDGWLYKRNDGTIRNVNLNTIGGFGGSFTNGVVDTNRADVAIDNIGFWNRSLSDSEILNTINASYYYGSSSGAVLNYSLYAVNKKNGVGEVIQAVNVTFINNSEERFYNTTTGSIQTNLSMNLTNFFNLTFRANGYKTKTINNVNITFYDNGANGNLSLLFLVNATNNFNENILVFNATINGTFFSSNSTGQIMSNLGYDDGVVNITADAFNQDTYTNLSVNLSNNLRVNFSFRYYKLNISAFSYTGNKIDNFTITATSPSDLFIQSTTTNFTLMNLTKNLNYTISINADGYEIKNKTIWMNQSLVLTNFTLYTTNSIQFNFKNESNFVDVYNVSFELLSSIYTANFTTNPNSTKYLDLLSPTLYTIRYTATGYSERTYSFVLINRTFNNLTLYMSPTGALTEITASVVDGTNKALEGAVIKVLKLDPTTGNYFLTSTATTNFAGVTKFWAELNSEFYYFIIEYPFGTIRKTTSPSYIYENTLTFQIILTDPIGTNYYNFNNVQTSFTTNITNFNFIYNDASNTLTQCCLYSYVNHTNTSAGSSCLLGASGFITLPIVALNGTSYRADAYCFYGATSLYIGTIWTEFKELLNDFDKTGGGVALVGCLILTAIFGLSALYDKSVALIITPLPMLFMSIIGFISIPVWIVVAVEALSLSLALYLSGK